jgi:hypothetical protein
MEAKRTFNKELPGKLLVTHRGRRMFVWHSGMSVTPSSQRVQAMKINSCLLFRSHFLWHLKWNGNFNHACTLSPHAIEPIALQVIHFMLDQAPQIWTTSNLVLGLKETSTSFSS